MPDHRIRNMSGASFSGFYYVCLERAEGDACSGQSRVRCFEPAPLPEDACLEAEHTDADAQITGYYYAASTGAMPGAASTAGANTSTEHVQRLQLVHLPDRLSHSAHLLA